MSHLDDQKMAREVARRVSEKGGSTFYVGGFVRDALIHRENKDVDIEVHGVSPKCLEEILDSLGQRMTIGESFGIPWISPCPERKKPEVRVIRILIFSWIHSSAPRQLPVAGILPSTP